MLRTYVYERTYVLLKYDPRLIYPLCYDPLDKIKRIYLLQSKPNEILFFLEIDDSKFLPLLDIVSIDAGLVQM